MIVFILWNLFFSLSISHFYFLFLHQIRFDFFSLQTRKKIRTYFFFLWICDIQGYLYHCWLVKNFFSFSSFSSITFFFVDFYFSSIISKHKMMRWWLISSFIFQYRIDREVKQDNLSYNSSYSIIKSIIPMIISRYKEV